MASRKPENHPKNQNQLDTKNQIKLKYVLS